MLPPTLALGSMLLVKPSFFFFFFLGNRQAVRTEYAFSITEKCCSRKNTLEMVDTFLD